MDDLREKVINGLTCCLNENDPMQCEKCRYRTNFLQCVKLLREDAVAMLKAQGEVIDALLKVGYPHNFQREEPWIVNYMYAITDVVRKAVKLE